VNETPLGGNLNDAVRVGDTVRRTTGPWTPAVHALLRFLERQDFPAPRVRGIDERGREILAYVEGEAHSGTFEPLPDRAMAEDRLVGAARQLRRYHDTVGSFRAPTDARWRLVAPTEHEIVCHNDWSPWNALAQDASYVMTLDWDLAGPGSRLWDVANAAAAWAALSAEDTRHDIAWKARRLRLFLDAYGLADRSGLLATARLRFEHVAGFITEQAACGDPGMRRLVSWEVPRKMGDDVRYLDEHRTTLERAISG
jgi:aminoglycoside phosphotransferase (APT) family kinase protein